MRKRMRWLCILDNRGVEIDSEVADGAQSCILQQVTNGVFMRMAILESLVPTLKKN